MPILIGVVPSGAVSVLLQTTEQRFLYWFGLVREGKKKKSHENDPGANDVVLQSGLYNRRNAPGAKDDFYVSEGRVCLLCGNGRVIVLPAMPGLG